MSGKYALIIGNTEYTDSGLAQLTAPGKDAEDFARVLKGKDICAFDEVNTLLNQPEHIIRRSIDEFFDQKKPDDLLILYFSGHGVRDELGALYLAVKNTNRFRLRSTAIKSDFIREAMDQSRSKRQVLILDCCNSGAFSQGTKAATGVSIGTSIAFESGYGRIILTASDATQYAWEGDRVIGKTDNSLFTHFLIEGLEGKADRNGDGKITTDEMYDYAYEQVKLATPNQTPSKFSSKQQGEIILRQNIPIEEIKPLPLPKDLVDAINSSMPFVREGAVRQLEEILKGKNLGLSRSARISLEKMVEEDDSRRISLLATQVLETIHQNEQSALKKDDEKLSVAEKATREAEEKAQAERKAREDVEQIAKQKIEDERLAKEKAEAEQKAKEEADGIAKQKAKEEHLTKASLRQELHQAYGKNEQQDRHKLIDSHSPVTTNVKSESIWKFSKQQAWKGATGTIAYALLSQVPYVPTTALLIFFGISYGPWVGLTVGIIGRALSIFMFSLRYSEPFYLHTIISILLNGIIGMLTGLTVRKFNNFRDTRTILKAIGLYLLVAIIFFILDYIAGYAIVSSTITSWVIGSILLTTTMIASANIVRPTQSTK